MLCHLSSSRAGRDDLIVEVVARRGAALGLAAVNARAKRIVDTRPGRQRGSDAPRPPPRVRWREMSGCTYRRRFSLVFTVPTWNREACMQIQGVALEARQRRRRVDCPPAFGASEPLTAHCVDVDPIKHGSRLVIAALHYEGNGIATMEWTELRTPRHAADLPEVASVSR
jgi:hypothetical protein